MFILLEEALQRHCLTLMDSKQFCKDLQTDGRAYVMCTQNMHVGPEIPLVRLSEVRGKCLDAVDDG